MNKAYKGNNKINIYGKQKEISEAEAMLDSIEDLCIEIEGYRLRNEGDIRLKIQDAMDRRPIKAHILVDGNTVYPFTKTIREYERLKKSGNLEKMTKYFYTFLYLNFDIAHYDIQGYIDYYNNDFATMKRAVLDRATTPAWHTDVQRILDVIQGRQKEKNRAA